MMYVFFSKYLQSVTPLFDIVTVLHIVTGWITDVYIWAVVGVVAVGLNLCTSYETDAVHRQFGAAAAGRCCAAVARLIRRRGQHEVARRCGGAA